MAKQKSSMFTPYKQRRFSGRGIRALLESLLSAVFLVLTVGWGIRSNGGVMMTAGALGIFALVLSFSSVFAGLKALSDDVVHHIPERIAILLGAVLTVVWFLTGCLGLAS